MAMSSLQMLLDRQMSGATGSAKFARRARGAVGRCSGYDGDTADILSRLSIANEGEEQAEEPFMAAYSQSSSIWKDLAAAKAELSKAPGGTHGGLS